MFVRLCATTADTDADDVEVVVKVVVCRSTFSEPRVNTCGIEAVMATMLVGGFMNAYRKQLATSIPKLRAIRRYWLYRLLS